jgi:hypothetical protein
MYIFRPIKQKGSTASQMQNYRKNFAAFFYKIMADERQNVAKYFLG